MGGAEEGPGDRGDRVGVVARVHRGDRARRRAASPSADRVADRRPRGLEGGDDVAVGREADGVRRSASAIQPAQCSCSGERHDVDEPGQVGQRAVEDGEPDRVAPQDARVARERVVMGGPRDGPCPASECDAGSSRKASATGAVRINDPLPAVGPLRRCRACDASRGDRAGRVGPGRDRAEHLPGLRADVGGATAQPVEPALDDRVERGVVAQAVVGRDLGDDDGHLGVVAPLARRVGPEAAADHPRHLAATQWRRAELVRHPEGVAARSAEEHALDPVGPGGVAVVRQRHAMSPANLPAMGWGTGSRSSASRIARPISSWSAAKSTGGGSARGRTPRRSSRRGP